MILKWPALRAELEQHSISAPGGRIAGWLVRCTASRKELGYVWQAGSVWRWQTPDSEHFGERSAQRQAVAVLRDAFDLAHGAAPRLVHSSAPAPAPASGAVGRAPQRASSHTAATPPKAPAAPPAPARRIVWNDSAPQIDIRAAIAAGFRKK